MTDARETIERLKATAIITAYECLVESLTDHVERLSGMVYGYGSLAASMQGRIDQLEARLRQATVRRKTGERRCRCGVVFQIDARVPGKWRRRLCDACQGQVLRSCARCPRSFWIGRASVLVTCPECRGTTKRKAHAA